MNRNLFIRLGLCEEATDLQTEGGKTPGAQTPPPATLTIGQRLKAAANIVTGGEQAIVDLRTQITDITTQLSARDGELTAVKADLETAKARIIALEADAKEAETALAAIEQESARLKAHEQDLTKRTAAGVKQQVAALGFPATQLPAAGDLSGPVTLTYAEAQAEYAKITDANARADYYAKIIQPMLDRAAA